MKLNSLKKIIKYRSSYSGTKETDIMYERYFIRNLEKFNKNELNLLISVFDYYSDDLTVSYTHLTLPTIYSV